MTEWIQYLDEYELMQEAPSLFIFDEDPEDAAIFLYKEGLPKPMMAAGDKDRLAEFSKKELESRPPKKYWEQVKIEFQILVCTSDKKYAELRKSLDEAKTKGTQFILVAIASTIASILGIEAGIISGFCAILLKSIIKIGKEAYCSIHANHT